MLKEFRDFILKGNMLDMAVGIVIGAAFGTVVKSLVNNILMPPIGLVLNNVDFSKLKWTIGEGKEEPVTINYGLFINDTISLIIIGFCIFLVVKAYNNAKTKFEKKKEEEPKSDPEPSNEEKLLIEIRDLLAKKG